jgi:hypothetical protein
LKAGNALTISLVPEDREKRQKDFLVLGAGEMIEAGR